LSIIFKILERLSVILCN